MSVRHSVAKATSRNGRRIAMPTTASRPAVQPSSLPPNLSQGQLQRAPDPQSPTQSRNRCSGMRTSRQPRTLLLSEIVSPSAATYIALLATAPACCCSRTTPLR